MNKQHISNTARFIILALLAAPTLTWANDCQQATQLYNRSLGAAPAQKSELLEQALNVCPNHVSALVQFANIKEKEGNWSKAQWLYHQAIQADPNFARAYAGLGDVLMQRNDYQEAAVMFDQFLTKANNNPALQSYVPRYEQRLEEAQSRVVVPSAKIIAALTDTRGFGPPKVDVLVNFDFNSAKVTKQGRKQCGEMAKAIKGVFDTPGFQKSQIRIEGHTDSQGSAAYNKNLSKWRANSVKKVLVRQFGIPGNRLKVVGWGEKRPTASNSSAYGRLKNRRVTLVRLDK